MEHRQPRNVGVKYMLAGGSVVVALGLMADFHRLQPSAQPAVAHDPCQSIVQPQAVLSRDRLSQLLAVPEQSNKQQIRQLMQAPYCRLADLEVRPGVTAEREAYPLEFDPHTWLVVLYEGEEYAGYAFSFRR